MQQSLPRVRDGGEGGVAEDPGAAEEAEGEGRGGNIAFFLPPPLHLFFPFPLFSFFLSFLPSQDRREAPDDGNAPAPHVGRQDGRGGAAAGGRGGGEGRGGESRERPGFCSSAAAAAGDAVFASGGAARSSESNGDNFFFSRLSRSLSGREPGYDGLGCGGEGAVAAASAGGVGVGVFAASLPLGDGAPKLREPLEERRDGFALTLPLGFALAVAAVVAASPLASLRGERQEGPQGRGGLPGVAEVLGPRR